jgi:hypothetical protein
MDRGGFQRFVTGGAGPTLRVGSIQVTAGSGPQRFDVVATYTFRRGGITESITSLPMGTVDRSFRLYVEESGAVPEPLQTGIAIANTSANTANVTLDLLGENGQSTGLTGTIVLPGFGSVSKFLKELPGLTSVETPFRGILRISTAGEGLSIAGIRARSNRRSDFLISAVLPTAGNATSPSTEMLFPHVVEGAGYSTEFVLFSNGSSSRGNILVVGSAAWSSI